jgi:hypothetical protein
MERSRKLCLAWKASCCTNHFVKGKDGLVKKKLTLNIQCSTNNAQLNIEN